jgi:hypothetical protein
MRIDRVKPWSTDCHHRTMRSHPTVSGPARLLIASHPVVYYSAGL